MRKLTYWFLETGAGVAYNLRARTRKELKAKYEGWLAEGGDPNVEWAPRKNVVAYTDVFDLLDQTASEFQAGEF